MSLSASAPVLAKEGRIWPHRQASRMVRSGHLDWHVQEMGDVEASIVLLVHGTGAATHSFRGLMPLLARSFRVVAIDLPGHGFTRGATARDLTLPGMAKALANLLITLNLRPQLGVGHSAGAAILLEMALTGGFEPRRIIGFNSALEPIRGNALLSPLAKLLFANPLTSRLVSFQARIANMARRLLDATGSRIDSEGHACYDMLLRQPAHVSGALGMMANWKLEPLIDRLGALKTPVSLIAASDDPMVPAGVSRKVAKLIPDCTVVITDHGGHLMHEADPELAVRLIMQQVPAMATKSVA